MPLFGNRKVIKELQNDIAITRAENERISSVIKSISLNDPILRQWLTDSGQLSNGSGEKLIRPYNQVTAVQAIIRAKARNFAQVPFRLYRGEVEVTSGPIFDLFQTINPTLDPFQFWEGLLTCLDIGGNAYIILDDTIVNKVPVYLWLFNPHWIKPEYTDQGAWIGWRLRRGGKGQGEFITPERVIQIKYYNPYDEILGLNPLDVLRLTNETMFDAAQYNRNFFKNDATPNIVYKNPQRLSERKLDEMEERLVEDKKGVRNAHHAQILTGDWDISQIGLSQKDMQFLEQQKFGREDICMIYGVPKKIIGLYEDINLATALSAELQFWEDTVMPVATMTEFAINKGLLNPLGYRGEFDFSVIDVLNQRVIEKAQTVQLLLSTGQFTRNEINRKFRLGFDEVPWGDEPVMPMAAPLALSADTETTKAGPMLEFPKVEMETVDMNEGVMYNKWAKDITPLIPIMSAAAKATRDYWHGVEQKLIKQMTKKVDGERMLSKAIDYDNLDEILQSDLLDDMVKDALSDEDLFAGLKPFIVDAMQRGIDSIGRDTGFTMSNERAVEVLQNKRVQVVEINQTAGDEIVDNLKTVISDGLTEGVGNAELSRRIVEGMTGQMKNIKNRSGTIARTEVNASFSQARVAKLEDDPPKFVRWISSRDSKVRDTHQYLDGKKVPYGHEFDNGLKFPHDPNGSAGEVINCRCTFEPLWGDD